METIVKELISPSGQYKVTITRRSDGIYRFYIYQWTHEIVEGYGEVDSYWGEIHSTHEFVDSLELAERLSGEEILQLTGEIMNDEVVLDLIRRYVRNGKAKILDISNFIVMLDDDVNNIPRTTLQVSKAVKINDVYLLQDKDKPFIWHMGTEENKNYIVCWSKYLSLKEALSSI